MVELNAKMKRKDSVDQLIEDIDNCKIVLK